MVVLQKHVRSVAAAKTLASRIIASIGRADAGGGAVADARRQQSAWRSPTPATETAEELLSRADRAMYRQGDPPGSYA